MARLAGSALFLVLCGVRLHAQDAATDSTNYWQQERQWKVRNFGHTIGFEAAWTKAHDLSVMQQFARSANVVDADQDYDFIYFLSASLAIHAQQDVSISRWDNGNITGHQWRVSLDRFIGRTSGVVVEHDSVASTDSLYRLGTIYLYSQNELALGLERRWRTDETRPFYFGASLGANIGTTTSNTIVVLNYTQLRVVDGTQEVESLEEQYPGRRCSYLRGHVGLRAGFRIKRRLDVALEGTYGVGLQMISTDVVRPITSRVTAVLATRWTLGY
ncbi:MAG: hypothetical protein IPJ76_11075 [Flavobacteriales bacterium]|nr:MAG: hypothetical protein IPJ76_11075 [Flavobacteriales bacterium]